MSQLRPCWVVPFWSMGIVSQGIEESGMPRGRSKLSAISACLFASALLFLAATASPVPASAATHSGSITDISGDGPEPARDLVSAAVEYEPNAGSFTFMLETAGPPDPTEDAQFLGALGQLNGEGVCSSPTLILATLIPGSTTLWMRDDDGAVPAEFNGEATRDITGNRITLSGTDPDMKGRPATCAVAIVSDAATGSVNWDETGVFPVREVKVARLRAKLQGAPKAVKRGRGFKAKVRLANPGNAVARGVKLKIGVKGKATVRPRVKSIGSLGAGKSRVVSFRIKTPRRAKGSIRITARASAKNAKASSAAKRVKVKVPRPHRPPAKNSGGLAGKLFWGFEPYAYDHSAGVLGLHFVNRRFVRLGMPKGGLTGCSGVTAKTKDGKTSAGCVRYSFNGRTGKVRIGGSVGTWRKGELKIEMKGRESDWRIAGNSWFGSSLPKAGARFKVKLRNMGYYGLCGVTPYCTTWKENLVLMRNGKFGRQKSSLSTGGGGSLPFVAISRLGPDERGRYQVLSRSRIRFRYADGKVKTQTIVVQLNKKNRPDPAREGLLIDDDWFFHDND